MDAEEEVGRGNNNNSDGDGDDASIEGRGRSNTWDFEEDHLLSYFLGGTGAPEPSGIHGEATSGHGNNDTDMHPEGNNGGSSETFSPSAGGIGMDMMVDASSAADALAASAAQASHHHASMGSPSVSFNFTHSPITGSLMMGGSIPGIGNDMKTGGPLLPPSPPGTNADHQPMISEGATQANSKSRKLPSSSSLKSSSSYTSHGSSSRGASSKAGSGRLGFVIGADEAPPPGRVTFADMGDDDDDNNGNNADDTIDEDSKNNIPKMGHGRNGGGRVMFGVEPPSTPATQYFGPSSSSAAASSASMQGHHRVPSASVLSTSSSSSSSLDKLGKAMAMNSVNPGQAVMEVHKTLQMKASELPTPPTPQMMMMLGNPAAAAAMAASAATAAPASGGTAASSASAQASASASAQSTSDAAAGSAGAMPGYSPISPAAGLGSPENMMLPPPTRWPMGGSAANTGTVSAGVPPPGAPQPFPMMNPQQAQAYFLQHQQFLQQLNYNAQMAFAQQQQQQQRHPSNIGQKSHKKELPPCPEVSNEDIVKAAAAAGIINPALGHGRPGRGGIMSAVSPDTAGSSAGGGGGRVMETEEKRQQRLARNRESARKSRRQKKERLQTLAAQVSKLQDELEVERRRCIGAMESGLRQGRADVIAGSAEYRPTNSTEESGAKDPLAQALEYVIRDVGPKCQARSATANFQHNTLQSQMLPNYREFILWLSTQHTSFLYTAKEERNNNDENVRKTSSSKQIGEELFGGGKPKSGKNSSDDDSSKADLSAKADDVRRFWPMFCYDMSISVDQEERICQLQNSMFHSATLPGGRQEASTAKAITRSLKHGILYAGHSSAHRSERALLDILTPEQSARYLQWYAANKDRCNRITRSKVKNAEASADALGPTSLDALSQRLNDAFHFRGG